MKCGQKLLDFMKQDNSENDTFEGSLQKLKTLLEKVVDVK